MEEAAKSKEQAATVLLASEAVNAYDEAHAVTLWAGWRSSARGQGDFWQSVFRSVPAARRPPIVAVKLITATLCAHTGRWLARSSKAFADRDSMRAPRERTS